MSINRRKFLGNITKTSLLGAITAGGTSELANNLTLLAAKPEAGHEFLTDPYLQAPSSDGMTIMWITNKLCYSWVEYGEAGKTNLKAHHVSDGMVTAYNRVNKIRLEHLKPDTVYSYRVVSKEILDFQPYKLTYGETIYSDVKTFRTLNPKATEVNWLVLNDIHDRPKSFPDLIKLNGDMFDYQTDEQQIIDHLLTPCTNTFASTTPFLFVRGNHETRGKFARQLGDYFASVSDKYFFSYQWGPVYNIVLDTGEDKPDDHEVYAGIVSYDDYRRHQAIWLEKEMQTKAFQKAPFRVVMMHIPHYYSGDWHGTMHCRELFAPLFNKYKVDLFIAGHTHKYGVFAPKTGQHNYPIIIGGGPKEGNRTIMKVKANQQQITLSMLRDDGTEVGSYVVKRR